jgi:hypothetical protein
LVGKISCSGSTFEVSQVAVLEQDRVEVARVHVGERERHGLALVDVLVSGDAADLLDQILHGLLVLLLDLPFEAELHRPVGHFHPRREGTFQARDVDLAPEDLFGLAEAHFERHPDRVREAGDIEEPEDVLDGLRRVEGAFEREAVHCLMDGDRAFVLLHAPRQPLDRGDEVHVLGENNLRALVADRDGLELQLYLLLCHCLAPLAS